MAKQMNWEQPFEYHFDRGLYYHEVHPNLICGTQVRDEKELNYLTQQENIGAIVNMQQDHDGEYWGVDTNLIEKLAKGLGVQYIKVPVIDFDGDSLRNTLPRAVKKVAEQLSNNNRTYIHCTAGLGRAPAVCIAYHYWLQNKTLQQAYDHVTQIRPCQPKWHSIRGATFDLLKKKPHQTLESLKIDAFANVSKDEREKLRKILLPQ